MLIENVQLAAGLSLSVSEHKDQEFLFALFIQHRPHLSQLPLPAEQLSVLVAQQYSWQQQGYLQMYPEALNYILYYQQQPVGKVMLALVQRQLQIIDLVMLARWQGAGFGRHLIQALQLYAQSNNLSILLSVEKQNNRAYRFYVNLGFYLVKSGELHHQLQWTC